MLLTFAGLRILLFSAFLFYISVVVTHLFCFRFHFLGFVAFLFRNFADVLTWQYLRGVFLSAALYLMFTTLACIACRNPCRCSMY